MRWVADTCLKAKSIEQNTRPELGFDGGVAYVRDDGLLVWQSQGQE